MKIASLFLFLFLISYTFCQEDDDWCSNDVSRYLVHFPAFHHIGSYYNSWGCADKFYFVPRHFQTTWENARSICRSYDMEIATFETLEEMQVVSDLCKDNENIMTPYVHVGGMTTRGSTKESWFWIVTGKRINYNMPWADGEPNNDEDSQFCLALGTKNFLFDDIDCFGRSESKFICQYKVDNYLE